MNELIAGTIAAPKDLPADAVGSVGTPNTLPADSAGIVGTPNTVPSDSAGIIAAPISLPSQGAAALPRSLTPMVDFDFAAKRYVQDGVAVAFEDIFTYTRASSATFTNRRLKKNGGYEYFLDTDYVGDVTNLLKHSEDFSDSDWNKTNMSFVTNAAISPFGGLTADRATSQDVAFDFFSQIVTAVIGQYYTVSFYVKAATTSTFAFRSWLNSGGVNYFKIITPTNEWQKVEITVVASGTSLLFQNSILSTGGVFDIYIWGAQLTQSAKALPYVKTLDVAVTKTFAETLRTEYDAATGENLGALIEGASTNLFANSESVNLWYKQYSSVETNATLAPDNTLSADKITDTSDIQEHFVESFTINQINGTFTASAYVKRNVGDTIQFRIVHVGQAPNTSSVIYYYDTDTFSSAQGVIDSVKSQKINNGWVKISVTYTIDNAVTYHRVRFHTISGTVAGTGTSAYIWGAQLEREPFVTSYIRTEGSAVSRSADNLHLAASGNVSFLDSTVHVVFDDDSNPFDYPNIYTHNGVGGNLRLFRGPSGGLYSTFRTGNVVTSYDGVGQVSITSTIDAVTQKVYKNGVLGNSATTIYPTPTINNALNLYLGSVNAASGQSISGHILKFSTYDQVLTQQEITLL